MEINEIKRGDEIMSRLTDRQKELFQRNKYILVDMIIILEHKLDEQVKELGHIRNEMLLNDEQFKSIIDDLKEQVMTLSNERNNAELALVKAQQEIDGDRKPARLTKHDWSRWKERLDELITQADKEKNE